MSDDFWVYGTKVTRVNGRVISDVPGFRKIHSSNLEVQSVGRYWSRFGKETLRAARDAFVSVMFNVDDEGTNKQWTPKQVDQRYNTSERRACYARARAKKV